MFTHHCDACDTTYLFFPTDITTLVNTDHGIEAHFDCLCGAARTELFGQRTPSTLAAA